MTTDADIAARPPLWQRLGLAGGRLAPGLGGFWRWWGLALASWLPARLRALLELDGRRLLLRHGPGELRMALERSGQARELARLPEVRFGFGAVFGRSERGRGIGIAFLDRIHPDRGAVAAQLLELGEFLNEPKEERHVAGHCRPDA